MIERISALIYDCEIVNCIPSEDQWEEEDENLSYCHGWEDFGNMGISVIGCFDLLCQTPRVFLKDNFDEFVHLSCARDHVIGFNSKAFDDKLCIANGIGISTTYDLLEEVRIVSGQPPTYTPGFTRPGYSLDKLARVNLGTGKTGSGAEAPILWQRGKIGAVIDYCLSDVFLTLRLFERRNALKDPVDGSILKLRDLF